MIQTVANTHFRCCYIKTIEKVIKLYRNCRVIHISFTVLGALMHSLGIFVLFSPQNAKSRVITHV